MNKLKFRRSTEDRAANGTRPGRPDAAAAPARRFASADVVNLLPNGSFGLAGEGDRPPVFPAPGGYYLHRNIDATLSGEWSATGSRSLRVVGVNEKYDTHFAPGGRDSDGAFRLGLEPGRTYTVGATLRLPHPLTGRLAATHLRISPGWITGGTRRWNPSPSLPATNAVGVHTLRHTFTVPSDATAAWIRFVAGMAEGGGEVYWDELVLTATDRPVEFFDGRTPDTDLHTYAWTGAPDVSTSVRRLREPEDLARLLRAAPSPGHRLVELAETLRAERAVDELALLEAWFADTFPDDPGLPLVQGTFARWRGDDARAVARLEVATSAPTGGLAELTLGRVAEERRDLALAEQRYREAYGAGSRQAGYALSSVLARRKQLDAAKTVALEAAAGDETLPFDMTTAMRIDPKGIEPRIEIGRFVRDHLDEIRARAEDPVPFTSPLQGRRPVFTYWHQGFGTAPHLVRRCHDTVREVFGDRVHALDGESLPYYADIPAVVRERVGTNYTHLSDIVRVDLLARYGGLWLDATCLVTRDFPALSELVDQDFFCFNYSGPRVGSWLMSSVPGGYAVTLLREAMFVWWERRDYLADYFQLHYVLEMLYLLDPRFRSEWDASRHQHPRKALALLAELESENDGDRLGELVASYPVHKITYKFGRGAVTPTTVLAAVVRGEHLVGAPEVSGSRPGGR